jgi:hypothetical protein
MLYIEGIHYYNMRLHSIIIIMGCQCNYLGKKLSFNNAKHDAKGRIEFTFLFLMCALHDHVIILMKIMTHIEL